MLRPIQASGQASLDELEGAVEIALQHWQRAE